MLNQADAELKRRPESQSPGLGIKGVSGDIRDAVLNQRYAGGEAFGAGKSYRRSPRSPLGRARLPPPLVPNCSRRESVSLMEPEADLPFTNYAMVSLRATDLVLSLIFCRGG